MKEKYFMRFNMQQNPSNAVIKLGQNFSSLFRFSLFPGPKSHEISLKNPTQIF